MSDLVADLLARYRAGESEALDELAAQLYPELKRLARSRARNGAGIGATTLVQETFVKMLSGKTVNSADRREFFALAATVMRQIVVDEIRYVSTQKRSALQVSLPDVEAGGEDVSDQIHYVQSVDRVLSTLESEDARLAKVFECRYFGGLSSAETAQCMDLSQRTAERLWTSARLRVGELIGG